MSTQRICPEPLVYIFCFERVIVFMLSDDIKTLEFLQSKGFYPDDNGALGRIKKFVEEAQKTPTNSKSMPLCDGCNKPFPELICYCEGCLDSVIRMGA